MKNKVVCMHQTGDPVEVAKIEEWELNEPGPGEVRVRMLAAPINPADINILEGKYGIKPTLPAVCGNEGVGEIEALGPDVENWAIGQRVKPPVGCGTWREKLVVKANELILLPNDLPVQQAAMIGVNPPTALRMLEDFVSLPAGGWVIQNAANSAVGQSVIQIARARGWKTLNIVRRTEQIEPLKKLGADVVVVEDPGLSKKLKTLTGGAEILLGLNAVGGDSATQVAKCLAPGGTLVTYGAMSKQPLTLPNGLLIFNDIRFVGFWLTKWIRTGTRENIEATYKELAGMISKEQLALTVDTVYPIDEIKEAIAHARRDSRGGKILLKLG